MRGLICWIFNRFQHSEVAGQFLAKEGCRSEKPSLLYWNLSVSPRTVTKLRISIVQYLNTAPLVWGFTNGPLRGKYDLSFTVPSQCAEDLRSGRADVAIIPAIEYQRIEDLVILPDMAIASKKHVRSLLVIAKKPIELVKRFALDAGSRSTQTLTRILCPEKWKIAPQFFESQPDLPAMLQQADAALIIGDPALRISMGMEKESWTGTEGQTICQAGTLGITSAEILYVYDVVGEWRSLTGLPAVLAVWAARRDVATPEAAADFLASRDFGLSRIPEICFDAARELELPQPTLESYLRHNIDCSLDEENRRGLELYFTHAANLGLIPRSKPIEWAATKAEAVKL
ncbi:MAG: hypothetical protein DMG48_16740 [Acidobacteria bacterium]|nr:MAG: hypothetical protein DMG48_16740 [Acidobacteriota bacterium]